MKSDLIIIYYKLYKLCVEWMIKKILLILGMLSSYNFQIEIDGSSIVIGMLN
jgi:hypothetical protein